MSPSVLLQALSPTLEVPGIEEVFEDVENPARTRSSEGGFTDFIQYQEDGTEETSEQASRPHQTAKTGPRPSSGPTQNKDKPVMQCCLENFKQFLSRLIALYITPCHVDKVGGERGEALQSGPSVVEGCQCSGPTGPGPVQRDCVAAFTAACQLFLECSSFPVYIAEGNLKSSPTQEEQLGGSLMPLFELFSTFLLSFFFFFFLPIVLILSRQRSGLFTGVASDPDGCLLPCL